MGLWRRSLLGLAFIGWGIALIWAYWWFDGRHGTVFERPAYFDGVPVTPPFLPGQIQVVHIEQADCPCNAGHQAYIRDMMKRFSDQGVLFARAGTINIGQNHTLAELPHWLLPQAWADWPGGPSVAIWDAQGRLAYVGPYSDGASCNSDSSFIEPVLKALLQGRQVNITRQDTVSCLCELEDEAFAQ